MTSFVRNFPFGANLLAEDRTRFRLWAPAQQRVSVEIDGMTWPMRRAPDGWFETELRFGAGPPHRYRPYHGRPVPDPAPRGPAGRVHGPRPLGRPPPLPL